MDILEKLECFEKNIQNQQKNLDKIKKDFERTKEITIQFLENCQKCGITRVGICQRDDEFIESKGWCFSVNGSVFADEKKDGWPAIWRAVKMSDISGGCGNSGQSQIGGEKAQFLQEGIYKLKNGKWYLEEK